MTPWPAHVSLGGILQLRSLKRLEPIVQGDTTVLPAGLSALTQLTSLNLGYCACSFAPGCLPASLRTLVAVLSEPALPAAILQATQLQRLQLGLTRTSHEALDAAGLEGLIALTYLSLHTCQLVDLPPQLSALTRLRALDLVGADLDGADLSALPAMPALSELDLCFNDLTELPPELLQWTNLEVRCFLHGSQNYHTSYAPWANS